MKRMLALSAFATFLATTASASTTLEVGPGKTYADIASAIAAAQDGDTVLVHDGVYEISAQIEVTKAITLKSVNGAEKTVVKNIGTAALSRVLDIDNAQAVVEGLTLTGGSVNKGGTLDAAGAGARIGANGGSLLSCIVSNNLQKAGVSYGAGVACLSANGIVSNCVITANRDTHGSDVRGYGVGVYMEGGEIVDSEISYNSQSCNYARGSVMLNGAVTMRRCKVVGNAAPNAKNYDWGADWQATAGVYVMTGGALIENCLIAGNVSKLGTSLCGTGGGLAIDAVAADVVSCTIVGNTAGVGGGVWTKSTKAKFVNCIIQDNIGDSEPQFYGASYVIAKNCICEAAFTKAASVSNLTGRVTFKEDSYEPAANQISYNAGTTDGYDWLATTVDLNGKDRIAFDAIDIGCYEYSTEGYEVNLQAEPDVDRLLKGATATYSASVFPATDTAAYQWKVDGLPVSTAAALSYTFEDCLPHTFRLEVTIDGVAQEPKESTVTACPRTVYVVNPALYPAHEPVAPYETEATAATNIEEALEHALDGATVFVDEGVYENASEIALSAAVVLVAPKGPEKTVLRRPGQLSGNNVSRRILSLNNAEATVSGFAIENGYGSVWSAESWGVGVNIGGAGGVVTNCIIRNCMISAVQNVYGAGVYLGGGTMIDCIVSNNVLSIDDQTYRHGGGGGVCINGGALVRCKVVGNSQVFRSDGISGRRQGGGGVLVRQGRLIGSLIAQNTSACSGAGIAVEKDMSSGMTAISNCTVVANASDAGVSGFAGIGFGTGSEIVNCCFARNVSSGGKTDVETATGNVKYSFCFGPEGELPDGEGNVFGTDAGFVGTGRNPYRQGQNSQLVDAGVDAEWMATAVDLLGNRRVVGRSVDIGCYEHQMLGLTVFVK